MALRANEDHDVKIELKNIWRKLTIAGLIITFIAGSSAYSSHKRQVYSEGEVLSRKISRGRTGDNFYENVDITYRFRVGNHVFYSEYSKGVDAPHENINHLRVGDKVKIFYDPKSPGKNNQPQEKVRIHYSDKIMFFVGIVLIVTGLIVGKRNKWQVPNKSQV